VDLRDVEGEAGDGLGLDADGMLTAVSTLQTFITGAVLGELTQRSVDVDAWLAGQGTYGDEIMSGGRFPMLTRVRSRPRARTRTTASSARSTSASSTSSTG
jgi:hypothetical protein